MEQRTNELVLKWHKEIDNKKDMEKQQIEEALKTIDHDIISASIKRSTYELARKICNDLNPNALHRCIMHILCNGITPSGIEFARFWLSLEFAVPLDLACAWDGRKVTCFAH